MLLCAQSSSTSVYSTLSLDTAIWNVNPVSHVALQHESLIVLRPGPITMISTRFWPVVRLSRRLIHVETHASPSARVRDAIMQILNLSFHQAVLTTGVQMARSTAEQIAHEHRDPDHPYSVVRRVPSHKLPLN